MPPEKGLRYICILRTFILPPSSCPFPPKMKRAIKPAPPIYGDSHVVSNLKKEKESNQTSG